MDNTKGSLAGGALVSEYLVWIIQLESDSQLYINIFFRSHALRSSLYTSI